MKFQVTHHTTTEKDELSAMHQDLFSLYLPFSMNIPASTLSLNFVSKEKNWIEP